ncbi:MAG: DUF1552 domain-containing protein, partial [Rhizobiaceae bacterium]
ADGSAVEAASSFPTFDTIMENSPSLYPAGTSSGVTKAMRVSLAGGNIYIQRVGNQHQYVQNYGNDSNQYWIDMKFFTYRQMYEDVFRALTNGTVSPVDMQSGLKTNILNRVYASFVSFKSNRKVSANDIAVVDNYLGQVADMQRSYASISGSQPFTCDKPPLPGVINNDPAMYIPAYIDLMVVAFKCGLSKYGSFFFEGQGGEGVPNVVLPQGIDFHTAFHGGATLAEHQLKGHVYDRYNRFALDIIANKFIAPMSEQEGDSGRVWGETRARPNRDLAAAVSAPHPCL